MYSPLKNASKDELRQQAKEKKRVQLTMLLINKFRNKFAVNSSTEPQIDRLVKDEVTALLMDQNCYESKLNQIDKKLSVMISKARCTTTSSKASQNKPIPSEIQ